MEQEKENEKFFLLQDAVRRFEDYEHAVNNNISVEELLNIQNECLNLINEVIHYSNSEPYSSALFYIRLDLLDHIKKSEMRKNQVVLNDITITRTPHLSFLPSLQKRINENLKQETETKKQKLEEQTPNTENNKLRNIIKNTLIVPREKGLEEIAGLEEAKNTLSEAIVFPIQFPHLFKGRRVWNKALLYGPPGTGKTQLAHCLAAETKISLYCVSNSDLWSRYVGESEKLVKTLFNLCQESNEQCMIFIDEIDSICRIRNSKESELERRFKNQLMIQLSEMDQNPDNKIFFLGSTNRPWELDPAFIRRFQRKIYIPLPDREARLKILQMHINMVDFEFDQILDLTEGWSGSDISELIVCALDQPIKELKTAEEWILTDDNFYMPVKNSKKSIRLKLNNIPSKKIQPRPLIIEDFFTALKFVTKSVRTEELKSFELFKKSY